jgi:hypothetical protein
MRTYALFALIAAFALSLPFVGATKVITLFEDDAAFIKNLSNQDSPTEIAIENADTFKGSAAIKITVTDPAATNGQKYNANIPDWKFSIVESPAADTEARWILLGWKSIGGKGIMIQFPDAGNWGAVTTPFVDPPAPGTRRYIAGENLTGWSGIQVSAEAPAKWTGVVRDLFADFGAFTLTGMALTPFQGVGLYDAIYLGATEAEVKAILSTVTAVEPQGKLAVEWADLKTR